MAHAAGPMVLGNEDDLIALRRDLHRHPELRFAEHRTAALLADRLAAAGYSVRRGVGGTGVVATLQGAASGAAVLLRADLDALPINDRKAVPYASINPGAAHACGHDVHLAVVVGTALRLAATGVRAGRLTIVLQPAEERPFGEPSGAQAMLDDDALADGTPDVVLGLHAWPDLPAGMVGVDARVAMASKDAFAITVGGRGGHAATPSRGRDAILALAALVQALHAAVARGLDASDRAAFNVGTIAGGRSQSVVAEEASLTGTLRTVDAQVRSRLRAVIERVTAGIAAAHDVTAEVRWADEMPAIVNDPALVERAIRVAGAALGPASVHRLVDPPMTADDFALWAEQAPALYLKLGVADPAAPEWPALHSSRFDVDERCIPTGVAVLTALATDLLEAGGGPSSGGVSR